MITDENRELHSKPVRIGLLLCPFVDFAQNGVVLLTTEPESNA
jgi:hypothetical protein